MPTCSIHATSTLQTTPLIAPSSPNWFMPLLVLFMCRDPWFDMVYGTVSDSLAAGGPLRGALFWQWDAYNNGARVGNSSNVREADSTFQVGADGWVGG